MVAYKPVTAFTDGLSKIIATAEKLFSEKGYDRVSMREIAETAGISKGLIYYHFKDKEALYTELAKEGVEALSSQLSQAVAVGKTPKEKIRIFIRNFYELVSSREQLIKILARELANEEGEVSGYILKQADEMISKLTSIVQEGINSGDFRSVDPRFTAVSLFGLVTTIVGERLLFGMTASAEKLSEHLYSIFIEGISS